MTQFGRLDVFMHLSTVRSKPFALSNKDCLLKIQLLILVGLLTFPVASVGDDSGERYEQLVDEMLEITGALKIGEQMSAMVVSQMAQAMKASSSDLPDRAFELLQIEVNETISKEMASGSFNEMMYPIYAKYLDEHDLQAALEFYSTKEGRKIAQAMPLMAADGMAAGQEWGAILGPKIARNVLQRLADEGIELQ
jgi:hypothetical protein